MTIKKQKTFESRSYVQDENALQWLLDLSKCFDIKKAKITSFIKKSKYDKTFCCRVEVEYE